MRKLLPLLLILFAFDIGTQAQCDASFTLNQNAATVFLQANNTSPGMLHTWKFGDGNQGWGANINHTYSAPGTYNLKHIITDSLNTCRDSAIQTVVISDTATNCNLNAAFLARVSRDTVFLQAVDSTLHVLHSWLFGDGNQGFGRNVFHRYNAPGTYVITHLVRDSASNCVDTSQQVVQINFPSTCLAAFVTKKDSLIPNKYHFISTSTASGGSIQSQVWTINGTFVSSAPTFSQTLLQGTHLVCIKINTTTNCSSSACDSIRVDTSVDCNLNAAFTARVNRDTVFLRGLDSSAHIFHSWKFGDGHTGTGHIVIHAYAVAGTYTITHYVTDTATNCIDSATQTVAIGFPSECNASFVAVQDSIYKKKYYFSSTSTAPGQSITAYRWTLNGHVVSTAPGFSQNLKKGVHAVCLTIKTNTGCFSTFCRNIVVDSTKGQDSVQYVASYPNPAEGSTVNVQLNLDQHARVKVTVFNSRGVIVYVNESMYSMGHNRVTIPVDKLQRGQYFIDIQYGNTRKRSVFQKL